MTKTYARICHVRATSRRSDRAKDVAVTSRYVVNATGAWGPDDRGDSAASDPNGCRKFDPVRASTSPSIEGFRTTRIVTNAIDGRQIFIQPWQNMSVHRRRRTTTISVISIRRARDERRGSLSRTGHRSACFRPGSRSARDRCTWAGVRPTMYKYRAARGFAFARAHDRRSRRVDGAPGVWSMVGGKLASYRTFCARNERRRREEASSRTATERPRNARLIEKRIASGVRQRHSQTRFAAAPASTK